MIGSLSEGLLCFMSHSQVILHQDHYSSLVHAVM